eukprot:EG_transcript_4628
MARPPPLRLAALLLLLAAALCGPGQPALAAATSPASGDGSGGDGPLSGYCGVRLRPDVDCDADVLVFVVASAEPLPERAERQAAASWTELGPRLLRLVYLVTRQDSAAVAKRLRLPCLRVPGTADGRPYLNAALHAAATACPAPRLVGLTQAGVGLLDAASRLPVALRGLLGFPWGRHPLAAAPPAAAFRRVPHPLLGVWQYTPLWLAISRPANASAAQHPVLWLWNTDRQGTGLTDALVPPLWGGTPQADAWLLAAAVRSPQRHVVDLSDVLPTSVGDVQHARDAAACAEFVNQRWLAQPYTTLSTRAVVLPDVCAAGPGDAPWRAWRCSRGTAACFEARPRRPRGTSSSNGAAPAVLPPLPVNASPALPCAWPFTLQGQLAQQATPNRRVLVLAGNHGFADYLWNTVCNLAKLGVTAYVIAALDTAIYEWAVMRGLPVFLWGLAGGEVLGAHEFGERQYERLTKAKPAVVYRILTLGYSVFFIDVDVVLFRNPLDLVDSAERQVMRVQSDIPFVSPNTTDQTSVHFLHWEANKWINSGFYFAPASPVAIAAFRRIVARLASPEGVAADGDQPIFNAVLCGPPHGRLVPHARCLYTDPDSGDQLDVRCWSQMFVAHGRSCIKKDLHTLFQYQYPTLRPVVPGQAALHNNWITGQRRKVARQRRAGLWWVDAAGVCRL